MLDLLLGGTDTASIGHELRAYLLSAMALPSSHLSLPIFPHTMQYSCVANFQSMLDSAACLTL